MNLVTVSKNHREIANGRKRRHSSRFQQFEKNTKYWRNCLKPWSEVEWSLLYTLECYTRKNWIKMGLESLWKTCEYVECHGRCRTVVCAGSLRLVFQKQFEDVSIWKCESMMGCHWEWDQISRGYVWHNYSEMLPISDTKTEEPSMKQKQFRCINMDVYICFWRGTATRPERKIELFVYLCGRRRRRRTDG